MGLWPETVPLDPDDGTDSSALEAILRGPAAALTAVVLVAGEEARTSGWAAHAAVALARRWPGPRRTVLVDLDVTRPSLHRIAGIENDQGIVDVVELGASLHRIAVPVAGERFALLPAGPFAGSGEAALLESDAWRRLLYEAAGRRETLLLYVPAASPATSALLQHAGAALVLAGAAEAKEIVSRLSRRYALLAILGPPMKATPEVAARLVAAGTPPVDGVVTVDRLGRDGREALRAALRRRQRAARLLQRPVPALVGAGTLAAAPLAGEAIARTAAVAVPGGSGDIAREARLEAVADDVALDLTVPPVAAPMRRKRRRPAIPIGFTIAVVLIVSLIAGSFHFLAGRFGRSAAQATAEPATAAAPASEPPAVPPPLPARGAVPYAVALEAHRDLGTAFERADALAAEHKDLAFYVAPLLRDSVLHYHLMAGPVSDSAAALALRDTLIARRVKTRATPSDIRYTPLALLIGDYSARADAEQQLADLRRLDIPAYLLVGVAADSAPLYRVFVGGFAGPAEADVVRQLLRAAGVRANLVSRTRSSTR